MPFISVFDVIGPNMVGPSSSHTAGAVSIALLAYKMMPGKIKKVTFTLYGSFAKTYRGHGTDRALVGGILGFDTDDLRIRDSFDLAKEQGIEIIFIENDEDNDFHPNTVDLCIENYENQVLRVRGESIGGGKVRIVKIDEVKVDFSGEYCALIVIHEDKPGVVAHISKCLSDEMVNIAYMRLFRKEKGSTAYSFVESDEHIPEEIVACIKENKFVINTMLVQI